MILSLIVIVTLSINIFYQRFTDCIEAILKRNDTITGINLISTGMRSIAEQYAALILYY